MEIIVKSHMATPVGYIPPTIFPWGTKRQALLASMDLYFTGPQCYVDEKTDARVYLYRGKTAIFKTWDRWTGEMVFEVAQ